MHKMHRSILCILYKCHVQKQKPDCDSPAFAFGGYSSLCAALYCPGVMPVTFLNTRISEPLSR